MDYTKQLRKNEVWVGNTDVTSGIQPPKYLSSLKSARLGQIAYDINGKPIDTNYMRPLFICRSELNAYEQIMESRYNEVKRY